MQILALYQQGMLPCLNLLAFISVASITHNQQPRDTTTTNQAPHEAATLPANVPAKPHSHTFCSNSHPPYQHNCHPVPTPLAGHLALLSCGSHPVAMAYDHGCGAQTAVGNALQPYPQASSTPCSAIVPGKRHIIAARDCPGPVALLALAPPPNLPTQHSSTTALVGLFQCAPFALSIPAASAPRARAHCPGPTPPASATCACSRTRGARPCGPPPVPWLRRQCTG